MVLSVENLSFAYNQKNILNKISFNLKKGETLAILGKNGAGKSTLLSLILGLLKSENGDILLLNQKIKSQRQRAQIIGFVPQSEKNIFSFKVTDMILFGLNANISLNCNFFIISIIKYFIIFKA